MSDSQPLPKYIVSHPEGRIHKALWWSLVSIESFRIASFVIFAPENSPISDDYWTFQCISFPIQFILPMNGVAFENIKNNTVPRRILIELEKSDDPSLDNDMTEKYVVSNQVYSNLVSPYFVEFWEENKKYIKEMYADIADWPPLFNFGRIVRNAISHNGKVSITNENSPTGTWRHLTYGPIDNGKHIIGNVLTASDLILLMFELSLAMDDLNLSSASVRS